MQNVLPGSYSINDVDATLHAGFALFHDADSLPGHRSSYVSGLRLWMIFISDERKWDWKMIPLSANTASTIWWRTILIFQLIWCILNAYRRFANPQEWVRGSICNHRTLHINFIKIVANTFLPLWQSKLSNCAWPQVNCGPNKNESNFGNKSREARWAQ